MLGKSLEDSHEMGLSIVYHLPNVHSLGWRVPGQGGVIHKQAFWEAYISLTGNI